MKKLFAAALVAAGIIAASSSAHATIFGDILKKHGTHHAIVDPKPTPKPKKTSSSATSFSYLDHPYFNCVSQTLKHVPASYAKDPAYQAATKQQCRKLHPFK